MLFFVVDVGCLFVVLWFWFCFWRGLGEIGINILEVNLTTYSGEKSKANGIAECGWIMGRGGRQGGDLAQSHQKRKQQKTFLMELSNIFNSQFMLEKHQSWKKKTGKRICLQINNILALPTKNLPFQCFFFFFK